MFDYEFLAVLAEIAQFLPGFLFAVAFHEFAHASVANFLGDDTAKKSGRLTLNPFVHIDWLGILFLMLFRIGWARPVPINHNNFKYPKLYSILTALAGPAANFLFAIVCFLGMRYFPYNLFVEPFSKSVIQLLDATASINVMLGVFNLLPIPPLDGSHVFTAFLSGRYPRLIFWLYTYSMFILIFILFFPLTRFWLLATIQWVYFFLRNLVFKF